MKVILQKDINGLGDAGEVKDVKDGYARNYLLPRKLVLPAHAGSARAVQHQQRLLSLKAERRHKKPCRSLQARWSPCRKWKWASWWAPNRSYLVLLPPLMIARALEEKGYSIDKRKIELQDSIRALGTYKARIKLAEGITVPLSVNVVALNEVEEEVIPDRPSQVEGAADEASTEEATSETTDSDSERKKRKTEAGALADPRQGTRGFRSRAHGARLSYFAARSDHPGQFHN
jgi:large subunit ribosomal protein L9